MSSGGNNSGEHVGGEGDGALHDPLLRRALDHAPDSGAMPDPRTRDAIRKMAHNLAAVSTPAPDTTVALPWWRRLFGGGETHSRMPWNAAFATVLVATFVTVLWYREPIPDARLDGEAQVAGAAAPVPPSAPSPAVVAQAPQAPAMQEAAPVRPAPPAAPPARDTANEAPPGSTADALRRPAAPAPASKKQAATAPEMDRKTAQTPPAPAPPAPAITAAPPPAAPIAQAGPPPAQRESADGAPGLSAQRNADAAPSAAVRQAPTPRAASAAKGASPQGGSPQFAALDNWASFNYVRGGQAVRHVRGDVEGLAASVNSVARSATVPGGELAAPVDARLELYRDTDLLAVLEIAGDQVRWTPQPGGQPSVGTPPASALAALRALLARQ